MIGFSGIKDGMPYTGVFITDADIAGLKLGATRILPMSVTGFPSDVMICYAPNNQAATDLVVDLATVDADTQVDPRAQGMVDAAKRTQAFRNAKRQ